MRPWIFPVTLEPGSSEPLFLQIAGAIRGDVERGRLGPGTALPGSRTLAKTLGVHRNTVLAAYRELESEGWTESTVRSTRISLDLPVAAPRGSAPARGLGFALAGPPASAALALDPKGVLAFGGGLPDGRLLPGDLLARAYRRALRSLPLLSYGDPRGEGRLRAALASLLSDMRGLACTPDQVMITGGSQMALALVAQALIGAGNRVVVEDPGYPPAWATLRGAGAVLVPVAVDEQGLDVGALEEILRTQPVRAIYLTPHHQFPTTATMSASRRLQLLALAQRHRIAILEDDYDFEFHFEGRPVLPLASRDTAGVVIYLGTLSKVFAPGLRLGFIAGPEALIETLAAKRVHLDHHGDQVLERAVAELLEDGLLQRHVRKARRIYAQRRDALAQALRKHLPEEVSLELPPGGMSFWVRTAPSLDAAAWARAGLDYGVAFYPGCVFDFAGEALPAIRLGFTSLNEEELEEAVRRMKAALRS